MGYFRILSRRYGHFGDSLGSEGFDQWYPWVRAGLLRSREGAAGYTRFEASHRVEIIAKRDLFRIWGIFEITSRSCQRYKGVSDASVSGETKARSVTDKQGVVAGG